MKLGHLVFLFGLMAGTPLNILGGLTHFILITPLWSRYSTLLIQRCWMSLNEDLSVFLLSWLGFGFIQLTWFHTVDGELGQLAKLVFVRFLHYSYLLPTPFHTVFFGRKSLCTVYAQGLRRYVPPPWRQSIYLNYLELFSMGDLSLVPIYTYVFMSLNTECLA